MPAIALRDLVRYLDHYLRIAEIPDEANAVNGLQVENASAIGATHRGRGRREPGNHRGSRGSVAGVRASSGASRTVLGRQRSRSRVADTAESGLSSITTPHSTRPTFPSTCIPWSGTTWCWPEIWVFITSRDSITTGAYPIGVQGVLDPPVAREDLVSRLERSAFDRSPPHPGRAGAGQPRSVSLPERQEAGSPRHGTPVSIPTSPEKARTTPTSMRWSSGSM